MKLRLLQASAPRRRRVPLYPTWVQKNSIDGSPFRVVFRPKFGGCVVQIANGETVPSVKFVAFLVGVSAKGGPCPAVPHTPASSPMTTVPASSTPASSVPPDDEPDAAPELDVEPENPENDTPDEVPEPIGKPDGDPEVSPEDDPVGVPDVAVVAESGDADVVPDNPVR